jgi:hypothetical protein
MFPKGFRISAVFFMGMGISFCIKVRTYSNFFKRFFILSFSENYVFQIINRYSFLFHGIAVSDGYGIVRESLMIDGDTIGSSDGILSAVASTDTVFFSYWQLYSKRSRLMISLAFSGRPSFFTREERQPAQEQ